MTIILRTFAPKLQNTMILNADKCVRIFDSSIKDYHTHDDVHRSESNPFEPGSFENLLYSKNWIDTLQWHHEDIIRIPDLDTGTFIYTKRTIDRLNQQRVDLVEKLDDIFWAYFSPVMDADAPINSETPAWILDRLSILCLKIWHMKEQTLRDDTDAAHLNSCKAKLAVLLDQLKDICLCYNQLHNEIIEGKRRFKLYRQMKMYNDASLNPQLYKNTSKG